MADELLFEDNHLLIVNKPAGLCTQRSIHHAESLEERWKARLKVRDQKPGNVFLHAVHRLDTAVSGIVCFAKSAKARARLSGIFRTGEVEKGYLAIIEGQMEERSGTLEHWLAHGHHRAVVTREGAEGAKRCVLRYATIRAGATSLVQIQLETGRYHQIRAQLAACHHPVVGDAKYGSKRAFHSGAIALHHFRCAFAHPVGGQRLEIEARFPAYWPEGHLLKRREDRTQP